MRFRVGGEVHVVRAWRVAVFLLLMGAFCLWFDFEVWSIWVDVPVEVAFGALVEWVFPTFGLALMVSEFRGARRALAEARRSREGGQ